MSSAERTTELLHRLSDGDETVADDLYRAIRAEMYRLARGHMAHRGAAHTLQSTALVHEAWVRLVDAKDATWKSRHHFYGMASKVMRSILVDHARRKSSEKRGGNLARVPLAERAGDEPEFCETDVLDLHAALEALEQLDPERARVLELRYFGGLGTNEIAATLQMPLRTVERRIQAATAWVRDRMRR